MVVVVVWVVVVVLTVKGFHTIAMSALLTAEPSTRVTGKTGACG